MLRKCKEVQGSARKCKEVQGRYVHPRMIGKICRWASEENVIIADYILDGVGKQLQRVVENLQEK
jgi:hypothetical protein